MLQEGMPLLNDIVVKEKKKKKRYTPCPGESPVTPNQKFSYLMSPAPCIYIF